MRKILMMSLVVLATAIFGEGFKTLQLNAAEIENFNTCKQIVLTRLPKVEGWCSKEKALAMMDLIIETNPKVCVEIGVFGGSSILPTASALKFLKRGVVYAIDPWDNSECLKGDNDEKNSEWWGKIDLEKIYQGYRNMLREYGLEKYCRTLRTTSEKAAQNISEIDILHIDGNHSEECSTFDVMTYLPKLKSGGYIWLDDTNWSTTRKAVEYVMESCDFVKSVNDGGCMLFRKR